MLETSNTQPSADGTYLGLDFDQTRKLLVGVDSLAWCFDCDPSTIRRWAKSGAMPKPLKVGGRTLWDAERIRVWIRDGCPSCDSAGDREPAAQPAGDNTYE
jgi:hypothetical protein